MFEVLENETIILRQTGSWPKATHVFENEAVWAIKAALAAERPLLIRGEPGSGKSQLARAAAQKLGRVFISTVVHARSESQDLLYQFDAVHRLGEAQALAAGGIGREGVEEALRVERFVAPGPLWWAFAWEDAARQAGNCICGGITPDVPDGWAPERGAVLLIDEIDKADADLPNGLLETLGNGAFGVPLLGRAVGLDGLAPAPLVIITTNEERELPAAFIRRCLVLHLGLPKEREALTEHLCARGEAHFGASCAEAVRREAARLLMDDRETAREQGLVAPGQAEYLDLLRALTRLAVDEGGQLAALKEIAAFALRKQLPESP